MGKKPGNKPATCPSDGNFENFVTNLDSSERIAYISRECVSTHKG